MTEVALFGGSFNPPHVGHLLAAAYVRAVAGVDALWLMPAYRHPFGKRLAPFEERVALCEALAIHVAGVSVSRVEAEVGGEGRTITTVEHLRRQHPDTRFSLIVGADILNETQQWYQFDRLTTLVRFIVLGRGGYPKVAPTTGLPSALFLSEVTLPEVSSTEVRDRLARGSSVEQLVPRAVRDLIAARGLYRAG